MAIKKILTFNNPILHKPAKKITKFDNNLQQIIEDLIDTMTSAPGLGLAAPQIGIKRRVIAMLNTEVVEEKNEEQPSAKREIIIAINPKIVYKTGSLTDTEGCLSFPEMLADVTRYEKIKVVGYDRNGNKREITTEGLLARIFQHEIDHLNGITLPDRAIKGTYRKIEKPEGEDKKTNIEY